MVDNFPLWPTRASTGAGNVDALYIFLLLLSVLMCAAIFTIDPGVCSEVSRPPRNPGRADRRLYRIGSNWSVIPFGIFLVIFV
jgi:hypothetical protein